MGYLDKMLVLVDRNEIETDDLFRARVSRTFRTVVPLPRKSYDDAQQNNLIILLI